MENKNDIGKAFRQKLDGLHRQAPDHGWASISGELKQKKAQRRFPWRGFSVLVILLIIITAGATYPLWEDDIPHIYIQMPDEHNSNSTITEDTVKQDSNTTQQEENRTGTTVTNTQNTPVATVPGSPRNTVRNNTVATPTETPAIATTPQGQAESTDGVSASAQNTDNPAAPKTTANETANATVITNNEDATGKVRMLDLSKVNYGNKDLNLKKEKKLDTRRIADSLNQLYGKVERIRVSFTVAPNVAVQQGKKMYYVQVIDPNNTIINETTEVFGNQPLNYSFITNAVYENKAITINEVITGRNFAKGLYRVNVYDKDKLVANTTFIFK